MFSTYAILKQHIEGQGLLERPLINVIPEDYFSGAKEQGLHTEQEIDNALNNAFAGGERKIITRTYNDISFESMLQDVILLAQKEQADISVQIPTGYEVPTKIQAILQTQPNLRVLPGPPVAHGQSQDVLLELIGMAILQRGLTVSIIQDSANGFAEDMLFVLNQYVHQPLERAELVLLLPYPECKDINVGEFSQAMRIGKNLSVFLQQIIDNPSNLVSSVLGK